MSVDGTALVNGREVALAQAQVALTDDGFVRGDGAFESVGVWDGRPFRLDDHLDRLAGSLHALDLPRPDLALLAAEAGQLLAGRTSDMLLRIYVTGSGTRAVTIQDQPPTTPVAHLVPCVAPWIRPVGTYALAGAKTLSYAPNMAAGRRARTAGGDDALLYSAEGLVLEGPNFGVCWVRSGELTAASVDLGIVDSVSRRAVFAAARDLGIPVAQGAYPLDALAEADEVLAVSALRALTPVRRVGDWRVAGPTPVGDALAKALDAARGR